MEEGKLRLEYYMRYKPYRLIGAWCPLLVTYILHGRLNTYTKQPFIHIVPFNIQYCRLRN